MRNTSLILIAAMGLLLAVSAGCQTDHPGVKNTAGWYSATFSSTPPKVTRAVARACKDLDLLKIDSNSTKVDGVVTARTAQDDSVSIKINQVDEKSTKAVIHVGMTGDKNLSLKIIKKTREYLE